MARMKKVPKRTNQITRKKVRVNESFSVPTQRKLLREEKLARSPMVIDEDTYVPYVVDIRPSLRKK